MSNKSRKNEQVTISNLPDRVISNILSRLHTKDAVKTSVLSKVWEYKWTLIPKYWFVFYEMNACLLGDASPRLNFVKVVERTILISQNLQKLKLICSGTFNLHSWITAALSRGVYCLDVESCRCPSFVLPCELLTCYFLRKLRLAIPGCILKVPEIVCVLNLTTLDLTNVTISNEHSHSDRVEFDFPLLEKLQLGLCEWLNIKHVEIHAPKMTSLHLMDPVYGSDGCSIKINGNKLEMLSWYGESELNNIAISGSADVVYASLEHYFGRDGDLGEIIGRDDLLLEKVGLQLRQRLNEFSNLKEFELSGDVAEVISKSKLGPPLCRYYKMERLRLHGLEYVEALLELLHAMPYLKILAVDVVHLVEYDYDVDESVPSCIASHLEKVTLTSFTGKMSEMKLVKFFLKNAVQLKSVLIQPHSFPPAIPEKESFLPAMSEKEKSMVIEELSTYPTTSTCLSLRVEEVEYKKLDVAC